MFANSVNDYVVEKPRRTPVAKSVDVLVAGAGPAGIATAIAAAREGANTLVLERHGYLGGMITGAHVVWVMGAGDGYRPKARGIILDIRERMEALGAVTASNQSGDYAVDAEVFKWQAAEMLQEAGADILLHTLACAPILSDACVQGLFTESKNGRQAIRAKVVIDCTADADETYSAQVERMLRLVGAIAFENVESDELGGEVGEGHGFAVDLAVVRLDHGGIALGQVVEATGGDGGIDGQGVAAEASVIPLAAHECSVDK